MWSGWMIVLITILLSSCLKDNTAEKKAEHDSKMNSLKSEYGMTDSDLLEEGIYRKIISEPDVKDEADTIKGGDYIIIDVKGTYAYGNVFDASDVDVAEEEGIYRPDLVYGPYRYKLDKTIYGFYSALQGLKEGTEVHLVFSHEFAFYDYNPVAYEIKVHSVIHDLDQYVLEQNAEYLEDMGIDTDADFVPGTDSLLYWKLVKQGTDSIDLEVGDIVKLRLYGYFAETDTNYITDFPGRQFFPINESSDTLLGEAGVQTFPLVSSLYAAIQYMTIGEIREVFVPTEYAYGEDGVIHPYVGKYLIPINMSLHYTVELLGHNKWNATQ